MALSPGRAMSSLTSPGRSARWCKYVVFLSFRGEDTRKGFVSNLYYGLELQGISTFIDERELKGGAPISTKLMRAIEDSCLAIIVLSPNYASSSWCLDELTKIVQCMDSEDSILPIFYDVDPSQVRHQLGNFEKAFENHDKKFTSIEGREKVKQWKANLTKVAGRKGWHLEKYKNERELIAEVVHFVWKKVQPTLKLFDSPHKFVGRASALHQLSELLDLGENDVRFIGITGMGGIGKTTLARIVFENISDRFDFHCFLEKVREASAKNDTLVVLQNQLLSSIFNEKVEKVWDEQGGANFIKNCLWNKNVLLVLDDVDILNQLLKLAGGKDWFGNGSRIIITTRNHRLLVEHDIILSYNVEGMSDNEALELFSLKAFKKDEPEDEFLELSEHFVKYAKGVPLVLHILGSFLYKRDPDAWNSVLDNLQNNPHPEVFDLLKISYDNLQAMEQRIFLDIACFHKGQDKEQVIDILDRRFGNISSLIVIDTLIERSLLNKSDHMHLEMHDLIQDMGRKIVDRESEEEPGKRTRIWRLDDLRYVLASNTGTGKVEAIVVNSPKLEGIRCSYKAFSNMDRLRLIKLDNVMIIPSGPISLPNSLRIIYWSLYPSKFLPQSFHTHYLTELSLSESKLVRLWEGGKDFPNLKIMDLRGSNKLTCTSDFTGMPKLEELRFDGCNNLVDIHSSIAVLKRLKYLGLAYCESIECLHGEFDMDSLEILDWKGCSKLKNIPEFSERTKALHKLVLDGTAIEQLPSSVGNLFGLTLLSMHGSKVVRLWNGRKDFPNLKIMDLGGSDKLTTTPDFTGMPKLEGLRLDGCTNLVDVHPSIAVHNRLQHLILSQCTSIKSLPSELETDSLEGLYLNGCSKLENVPEFLEKMKKNSVLDLTGTGIEKLPSSIENLAGLTTLNLHGCKRLCVDWCPKLDVPRRMGRSPVVKNNFKSLHSFGAGQGLVCLFDPQPRDLVSSSLSRLCCLKTLDLSDCDLSEGAIPEDIGRLSSLQCLYLDGNNFVSLPTSISWLSKLDVLHLQRCRRLRELPALPPLSRRKLELCSPLYVNASNCTSLQRLTDPSKLSSRFTNLYDFDLRLFNCIRLVEDESWINYVLSRITNWATSKALRTGFIASSDVNFVFPGSEFPEWFSYNKCEDLPPRECTNWLGIAFCVVFAEPEQAAFPDNGCFKIDCSFGECPSRFYYVHSVSRDWHLGSEHVWVFYVPREVCGTAGAKIVFESNLVYGFEANPLPEVGMNIVKKWAARLVLEQDLEELNQRLEYDGITPTEA